MFEEASELDPGDLIVRTNCKFCIHPVRHQAEARYEQTNSYASVERFFRDYEKNHPDCGKMEIWNIRNHLLKHYKEQEKRLWLKEYARDCKTFMNYKISQQQRFEFLQVAVEKQLIEVAANPLLDKVKQSDAINKLGKLLLDIEETQAKLRGDLKPVNVITERFMNVWLHVIGSEKNESVKRSLIDALDRFQEHMQGGITVEE